MKDFPDLSKPDVARKYLKGFAIQRFGGKPEPITEYVCGDKSYKVDEMTDSRAILAAHQMFRSLDWRAIDATIH